MGGGSAKGRRASAAISITDDLLLCSEPLGSARCRHRAAGLDVASGARSSSLTADRVLSFLMPNGGLSAEGAEHEKVACYCGRADSAGWHHERAGANLSVKTDYRHRTVRARRAIGYDHAHHGRAHAGFAWSIHRY